MPRSTTRIHLMSNWPVLGGSTVQADDPLRRLPQGIKAIDVILAVRVCLEDAVFDGAESTEICLHCTSSKDRLARSLAFMQISTHPSGSAGASKTGPAMMGPSSSPGHAVRRRTDALGDLAVGFPTSEIAILVKPPFDRSLFGRLSQNRRTARKNQQGRPLKL